ncbi:MAG TPA: glycosyltransferase family 4 protein, partial [Chryseolinea sp.]|nr:glycosyltransferase family 4 protein [Chryseolinea sp.]
AAFDVYMMSSVFEGLPVALLEAMAMRCPVIATNAGGIKELIRHEVDGLLCTVEEPEKLVANAYALLQDESMRTKYGDQARKRVIDEFSLNKMVTELENVYSSLHA